MKFIEAINAIEAKVAKLRIRYPDTSMMDPVMALGKIGKFHGDRFDSVIDDLESGKITVEQYYIEMVKMIHKYKYRNSELDLEDVPF